MYTLASASLEVSILDPVADQERFGVRYCTGGYIFQINDQQHGPLLSGPTYPNDFNWFDGQGIPDAFNMSPLYDRGGTDITALIIGTGVCELQAKQVLEFCRWNVQQHDSTITMQTTQTFGRYALELERSVSLSHRTVRSRTLLKNTSMLPIPIRWFPHPFYPQGATDELCRFSIPVSMPPNPSYELAEHGFVCRKGWPWQDGRFQALEHNGQAPLHIVQRHPSLGLVAATCSYSPGFFPIWGNQHTFSWEPYFERTISFGQTALWWIDYDF